MTFALADGNNGGLASNYSLANGTATGSVTAKALAITANTVSKVVGTSLTFGSGSAAFSTNGLVTGESVGSVTLSASGGTAAADLVGAYTLTPTAATGGTFKASNYTITYVAGTLRVISTSLVNPSLSWTGAVQKTYGGSGLALPLAKDGSTEVTGSFSFASSNPSVFIAAGGVFSAVGVGTTHALQPQRLRIRNDYFY